MILDEGLTNEAADNSRDYANDPPPRPSHDPQDHAGGKPPRQAEDPQAHVASGPVRPSPAAGVPERRDSGSDLRDELEPDVQIVRPLGRSPVASVYLGREAALRRLVAVKVLAPELAEDPTARLRFEREAQAAAAISHPNVVEVHRVGRLADATPYLVMQYVKGTSLADRLAAEGALSVDETRRLLAQVASALAAAHKQGIVHRDVRPGNILYEEETGRVLLTDFGIAAVLVTGDREPLPRLTRTGEMIGDPSYMSPEQLGGLGATERSDVYNLGLVAFELLTGRSPYEASSPGEFAAAHQHDTPLRVADLRPDVDAGLDALLARCLAKKPEHRPSASSFLSRLGQTVDGDSEAETSESEAAGLTVFGRLRRRHVPQVMVAYAAGGWITLQIIDQLVGRYLLPEVAYQLALVFVFSGLPAAFVIAWYHGGRGRNKIRLIEIVLLGGLLLVGLGIAAIVLVRAGVI